MGTDSRTQQEREHQLVFLKQRAADIAVQAEREIAIDILNSLRQVVYNTHRTLQLEY